MTESDERLPGCLWVGALALATWAAVAAGCGASAEVRASYATTVAECIAHERAIVDRQGTTEEQDEADLAAERARCDAALTALGGQ